MSGGLKSGPLSPERAWELERRVEKALAKYDCGESLTGEEEAFVYWVRHGGGCSSCAAGMPVAVRDGSSAGIPRGDRREGESKPKTEVVGARRRERGRIVVS